MVERSSSPVYIVKSGDSLWKIANQFGFDLAALMQANGIDPSKPVIKPKQELSLPTIDLDALLKKYNEETLSKAEMRQLQTALNATRGKDAQIAVDGIIGNETREAIEAFKTAQGQAPVVAETPSAPAAEEAAAAAPQAAIADVAAIATLIARHSDSFQRGASGDKVRELQQRLTDAGFDPQGIDGKFGKNTKTALGAFTEQNKAIIGMAEAKIREEKEAQLVKAREDVGAALEKELSALPAEEAKSLESNLQQLGYHTGAIDGVLDAQAYKAIGNYMAQHAPDKLLERAQSVKAINFETDTLDATTIRQSQQTMAMLGLPVGQIDGVNGNNTIGAAAYLGMMLNDKAPQLDNNQIKTLQEKLRVSGYYQGAADGNAGPQTQKAIDNYLKDHPVASALGINGQTHDLRLSGLIVGQNPASPAHITENDREPNWASLDTDGVLIAGNNPHAKSDPASTTKMATLLTLADMQKKGDLPKGFFENPFNQNMLNRMMYNSDNEAAAVLSARAMGREHSYSGLFKSANIPTDRGFTARMNEMAQERGLASTQFANAHGYPQKDHYSSAHDMARFTFYLVDEYKDIADTYASAARSRTGGAGFAAAYGEDWGKTGTGSSQHGRLSSGKGKSWVGGNENGFHAVTEATKGEWSATIGEAAGQKRADPERRASLGDEAPINVAEAEIGELPPPQQFATAKQEKPAGIALA